MLVVIEMILSKLIMNVIYNNGQTQAGILPVCIRTTGVCGISEFIIVMILNIRNVAFSNLLEVFCYIKFYYWARTSSFY